MVRVIAGVTTHCAHGTPMNEGCPRCSVGYDADQHPLIRAARELAAGKVRYAEHFLSAKLAGKGQTTDGQAHQQAVAATKSELDELQARYELERSKLPCR